MSSRGDSIIVAAFGFGAGIYFFYKGLHELRLRRLIQNTPTSKIRSMSMGLVELKGNARFNGAPLISPISKKECVFYSYIVEEYRNAGKHSRWVKIAGKKSGGKFCIEDDTGKVLIDPTKIRADYKIDLKTQTSRLSPDLDKFLQTKGYKTTGIFRRQFRCKETFVEDGDEIYVLAKTSKIENGSIEITGEKCNYSYISDRKEGELSKSLILKTMLKVWGGAALTVACLAYILMYFNIF